MLGYRGYFKQLAAVGLYSDIFGKDDYIYTDICGKHVGNGDEFGGENAGAENTLI